MLFSYFFVMFIGKPPHFSVVRIWHVCNLNPLNFKVKPYPVTFTIINIFVCNKLRVSKRFIRNWLTAALEITRPGPQTGRRHYIDCRTATTSNRYELDRTLEVVNLDVEHSFPLLITTVTISAFLLFDRKILLQKEFDPAEVLC